MADLPETPLWALMTRVASAEKLETLANAVGLDGAKIVEQRRAALRSAMEKSNG